MNRGYTEGRPVTFKGIGIFCTFLLAVFLFSFFFLSPAKATEKEEPSETCQLLAIAFDEAQLAAAWYISAAPILVECGYEKALEMAERKACAADRWNGYESKDCPKTDDKSN